MNGQLRVLVMIPQLPHDPASGASRTICTVGEVLAESGVAVQTVATTATEGHAAADVPGWLASQGVTGVRQPVRDGEVIRWARHRVEYTMLDVADQDPWSLDAGHERLFDRVVDDTLKHFRPHFCLTYGGSGSEVARQRRVRSAGTRLVFGLYNTCYLTPGFFEHVDAVVTPSEYLAKMYRTVTGLRSTALRAPMWQEDIVAPEHALRSLTMVNPLLEKGLVVFSRVAAVLGDEHPDIPIEVYTARGSANTFMQTAWLSGADLADHPNLIIHETVAAPNQIYRTARVVLVPSLMEDAAPRVVAEAFVNGIPPIGSDRGGIPEMCADAGFVLPVSRALDPGAVCAVSKEMVRPWVDLIVNLFHAPGLWSQASEQALVAGAPYLMPEVGASYRDYFEVLLRG